RPPSPPTPFPYTPLFRSIDVLRLTTSLLLGGRELGANGRRSIELAHVLVDSYVRDACYANKMPPAPPPVAALLARVERRSHRMLDRKSTRLNSSHVSISY